MQKALLILSLFFIFTQDTLAQSAGTPVTWTDLVGVTVLPDNTLKKTAPYGTDNGGAASQEVLPANTDGWVETTVLETGKMRYFGLSDTNTDATLSTMDYAIELSNATPNVFVYENGTKIGWYGQYTTGEVYRIERVGTTIYYKRDGVTFYTSTAASTTDLVADVTIYHTDVTVNAQISFGSNDPPSASPVTWTDLVGVNVETDNTLTKTAPYGTDNGGAASQEVLPASTDGWAETTVLETGTTRYFGLSDTNTDATLGTMDYAIELTNYTPKIFVYENGTRISYFGEYAVGEVYRIERVGTTIYYKRDGTTFYTSTVPSTTSLLVDVSIHVVGGTIHNAQVSFGGDEPPPASGDPVQTIAINFDSWTQNTPQGWNRTNGFGVGGSIDSLINMQQVTTAYRMEVTDNINGSDHSGLSTGNNSGPVPDAVMATRWHNKWNQGVIKFTLDKTKKYSFHMYGGTAGTEDIYSSDYIIGEDTVTLNNLNNTINEAVIDNVVPNENNEVFFTIRATPGYEWAVINGMLIKEYSTTANQPPVLDSIGNQQLAEGGVLDIHITAADPDGDSLALAATGLPAFASFTDNNDGTAILSLAPGAGDEGNYPVTITATDQGGLSDSENLSLSVTGNTSTVTPLYLINAGGPAYTADGESWQANEFATAGSSYTSSIAIEGTENDQLYQSEFYAPQFTYDIPVTTTGPLTVKLHFAEIYHGINNTKGVGARVFDVDIENGEGQLTGYDIIEQAGAPATAIVEILEDITVNDGSLTIDFTATKDQAKISGIEVLSVISGIEVPNQLVADSWTDTDITLSWQDNATNETSYTVERSNTSGSGFTIIETLPEDTEQFTDDGLLPGHIYYYRIQALGDGGITSGYSEEVRIRTAQSLTGNTDLVHKPRFNGFISAIKWKNYGDSDEKIYTYHYDGASRLSDAQYAEGNTAGDTWTTAAALGGFSVLDIGYDPNGNITGLNRQRYDGSLKVMDALSYNYQGNRLLSVDDNAASKGFADGNIGGDDYEYDANGNLVKDLNQGIALITYNHLDLPRRVDMVNGNYILYMYDAAGTKLARELYDADGSPVKHTDYMDGFVYENDALQFIRHPEGRVVIDPVTEEYVYQYHLRDHLGNTRLTLSTKPDIIPFTATFESDGQTDVNEEAVFSNIENVRTTFLGADANSDGGNEVVRLNGSQPMGAGLSLPVSPGDKLSMSVWTYYEGGDDYDTQQGLATLVTAIAGGFGGMNGGTEAQQATYDVFDNTINDIGLLGTNSNTVPGAYLNYILFDEDMVYYQHGFVSVDEDANMAHDKISIDGIVVPKTGFVYIYLSNESASANWVYFDDMEVTLEQFGVVQADDYYPYGLTFDSYYKVNARKNDYLYQGKELLAGTGWYDFHARRYSPALGRFLSVDPQNQFASGFVGMGNNPINGVDPDGEFWHIIVGAITGGITNVARNWDEATSSPWGWFKTWETGAFVGAAAAATGGAAGAAVGGGVAGGVVGGAAGGFVGASGNAWTNGARFVEGLEAGGYGVITGAVGGGLSAFGGGSFAANLAWGVGEGAATGALGAALYGEDVGQGALYGGIAGGVFATATSPQLRNALKGQGFRSNNKVLADFVARGNYQGALDYFGFEGSYLSDNQMMAPDGTLATGKTLADGSIGYSRLAFDSFAKLTYVNFKESFHSWRLQNGGWESWNYPKEVGLGYTKYYPEEAAGFIHAYKNQGLFLKNPMNYMGQIEFHQSVYTSNFFKHKWWHFIYRIPRRY